MGCGRTLRLDGARLEQQSHQLVGAQGQDAKHQMTHHLEVAPDHEVADQLLAQMLLDQRLMHPFGQTCLGKLRKGAREGCLRGQRLERGEATDAAQRPIYRQALNQAGCSGESQYAFGNERVRQPSAFVRWATNATPRGCGELLDAHPFQNVLSRASASAFRPRVSALAADRAEPQSSVAESVRGG